MRTMYVLTRPEWDILKGGYWLNAIELGLNGHWAVKWDPYIGNLKNACFKLGAERDTLVWSGNKKNGELTAKLAYDLMIRKYNILEHTWWSKGLSK